MAENEVHSPPGVRGRGLDSDKARGFRSLILGVNENGKLRYAGKVGTGFDTAEIYAPPRSHHRFIVLLIDVGLHAPFGDSGPASSPQPRAPLDQAPRSAPYLGESSLRQIFP
jgi:hypothetical protein